MLATVDVPTCPVCGTSGGAPLHTGLEDRAFGVAPGTWDLVRCGGCGAARLRPRPADEAIGELYARYYTHEPPEPNLVPANPVARAARALRNDHVNRRLGYALSPSTPGGALLGRALPALGAVFERSLRSLPRGGRLLDVGAGNGLFVAEAAASGWDAAGIDLDADGVAAGRSAGLDFATESIEQRAGREPGAYDAVTLSHVVEHVPDPVAFLRAAHELLRPGGLVWVATPNLDAAGHAVYGRDWLHLDPPRHLVLFDAPSLARALARAGFTRVRVLRTTPNALPSFVKSHAVRMGAVPANDATSAPRAVRLAALRAEAATLRDRRRAEELVVLAERP